MSRPRCVIAGGAGAVGGLFAGLLSAAGADVVTVDSAPGSAWALGDITTVDAVLAAELAGADMVLLAVPGAGVVSLPTATGRTCPGKILAPPVVASKQPGRAEAQLGAGSPSGRRLAGWGLNSPDGVGQNSPEGWGQNSPDGVG